MCQQVPSPHSKEQISGKLVAIGISDVAIASVHSKINCLKKMIMIIIIISMNKLWAPEIDFRYESEARKMIVDFKFDAYYR